MRAQSIGTPFWIACTRGQGQAPLGHVEEREALLAGEPRERGKERLRVRVAHDEHGRRPGPARPSRREIPAVRLGLPDEGLRPSVDVEDGGEREGRRGGNRDTGERDEALAWERPQTDPAGRPLDQRVGRR
jgi:hypothetical protein